MGVGITLGSLVVIAGLTLATCVIYSAAYRGDSLTSTITNTTGLVQAKGRSLYDKNGKLLRLKGVNIGNCFVSEQWLSPLSVGAKKNADGSYVTDKDGNIQYPEMPEETFLNGFASNPNISPLQREELLGLYYTNWFSEVDAENIAAMGLNEIRVPFYWRNILNDDYTPRAESEAFRYLDPIVEMCARNNLYVVLDLHGAVGGQNGYEHSGTFDYNFYTSENIERTATLWKTVANHYKDSELGKTIASYDLLNEPCYPSQTNSGKVVWDAEDSLYQAIRSTGDKHNITIEGTWFFMNLPVPANYGWDNIQLELHWYNWGDQLPYWLFFAHEQGNRMLKDINAPIYLGEFTYFSDVWSQNLAKLDRWGYSWSFWTYKMTIPYWWNNTWGVYNQKLNLDSSKGETLTNVATDSYAKIKATILSTNTLAKRNDGTPYWDTSDTYTRVKTYLGK